MSLVVGRIYKCTASPTEVAINKEYKVDAEGVMYYKNSTTGEWKVSKMSVGVFSNSTFESLTRTTPVKCYIWKYKYGNKWYITPEFISEDGRDSEGDSITVGDLQDDFDVNVTWVATEKDKFGTDFVTVEMDVVG